MTSGSCCVADYYFVIDRIMKKIVILVILLCSIGFSFAQISWIPSWPSSNANVIWETCSVFTGDANTECMEKVSQCQVEWWSPDRCACKAIGGISLNTNVPFVGNCISLRRSSSENTTQVTPDTAFPILIIAVTKIMMTVILVFCFLAIIIGWVMMSMGWADESQYTKWKDLIKHVVIALALFGASGVILRIINPSFFT